MSVMPSLCAALESAGGERLVMRAGERPHVLAGQQRLDVASAVLSINAVEALAEQILSPVARQELAAQGSTSEPVPSPSFSHPLTARAERVGDDFCIELIVSMPMEPPLTPAQPETGNIAPVEPVVGLETPREPEINGIEAPMCIEQPAITAAPEPGSVSAYWPEPAPTHVPQIVAESALDQHPLHPQSLTVVTDTQVPTRPSPPIDTSNAAWDLFAWIGHAASLGATTLYLRSGSPAAARIDERIQPIGQGMVAPGVLENAIGRFTRGGEGLWEPRGDGEWVHEGDDLGYISCRIFTDLQGSGLVVHLRPSTSLRLLYKHIPRQVRAACEGNGLVVVAASTEADVEPLAAAVADWSGRDRGGYLISLQRRGRSHRDIAGAFVSQRTIAGTDEDFAAAIRRATQERPDILLVTGLEAEQPLQAAALAAAGGRLVIAGVVASTTVEALRMLAGQDAHVRRAMAASFRAAIGYRSLRRLGGGRTLIQDVVLPTSPLSDLLEAGDFDGLARLQSDVASRMRSVDESLARAVTRRQVSLRQAAGQAIDRRHFVALVRSRARTNLSGSRSLAGNGNVSPVSSASADAAAEM